MKSDDTVATTLVGMIKRPFSAFFNGAVFAQVHNTTRLLVATSTDWGHNKRNITRQPFHDFYGAGVQQVQLHLQHVFQHENESDEII